MTNLIGRLEASVGKDISQICDGNFHETTDNHCAHYVSHILNLDFSLNCREFKGGNGSPANIRVQEIFSECSRVGKWKDADIANNQLVFVTKISNVDIANKKMRNVPQKHIGIYCDGLVYHYSNSRNKAVKCSPEKFLQEFDKKYSGQQGLFFGSFPGSELELTVTPSAVEVSRGIAFDLERQGNKWFASPNGDSDRRFYVGRETNNGNYVGLFMRSNEYYGSTYSAEDYIERYDHWAQLMELTGYCESKNHFNLINTYDSAKFTFGFYQLAAHTEKDNLILLFRAITRLSGASDYFPELKMHEGRLHRVDEDGTLTDLEVVTATGPGGRRQLQRFMDFLNAKRLEHDMQEVLQAARLIFWANEDARIRDLQVEVAYDILQTKMGERYAKWYDLDGKSDTICALIADIHHQGRASKSNVRVALHSNNPVENLITVNPRYTSRISSIRNKLDKMIVAGQLGEKTYNAGLNEFR